MPDSTRLATCQGLMSRLVETLEQYACLSSDEKARFDAQPVYQKRNFLSKRQLLLNRSHDIIEALKAYGDLLKDPVDNTLTRLQRRLMILQEQCDNEDSALIETLTTRKAAVATKLHQLFHAKKTLQGYGKQGINSPRFLDRSE